MRSDTSTGDSADAGTTPSDIRTTAPSRASAWLGTWSRTWRVVVALLGIHLAVGIWTIRVQPAPTPPIDVFVFQRDSVAALLSGANPYSITFPNPYPDSVYYGPGMVADGRLQFGFVYPPLSVYLSTVGQ